MNKPRHTRPSTKPKATAKAAAAATALPQEQLKADQTAAFFREVDEAMRVEKIQNLWQQWRWPLFGAVGAVILGLAAWQGTTAWQAHQDRTTAAQWDELLRLQDETKLAEALPKFATESRYGYHALAQMAQAAAAKTAPEKLAAFRALADNTSQPAWLRALGQLNAALVLLETNPAEGQAQLELLTQTEIGTTPLPTVPLALEVLALNAMAKNDFSTAKAYTQKLLDLPQQGGVLTPALRTRALQRMGTL
jgi:hypothetical protein